MPQDLSDREAGQQREHLADAGPRKLKTSGREKHFWSNLIGPRTVDYVCLFFLVQVVLGGGQEAMDVTTTSTRIGKFDARFFHMVFEVSAKNSNAAGFQSCTKQFHFKTRGQIDRVV